MYQVLDKMLFMPNDLSLWHASFTLGKYLNTSFSQRNTLGMRTNSVDMDTVIETMILDVEEENGVEYEWVKDDE